MALGATHISVAGFDLPMDENANGYPWGLIQPQELARLLSSGTEKVRIHGAYFVVLILPPKIIFKICYLSFHH